jgi:hypothetical protein
MSASLRSSPRSPQQLRVRIQTPLERRTHEAEQRLRHFQLLLPSPAPGAQANRREG